MDKLNFIWQYNLADEFKVFSEEALTKALLDYASHPRQMTEYQRFVYLWEKAAFYSRNLNKEFYTPETFSYEGLYYSSEYPTLDSHY